MLFKDLLPPPSIPLPHKGHSLATFHTPFYQGGDTTTAKGNDRYNGNAREMNRHKHTNGKACEQRVNGQ